MSRGCGCQTGILRWFKPPYAELFYAACCIHDDDYDRGGDKKARKMADKQLFWNIYKKIELTQGSVYKTVWLVLIAMLYYVSVRMFGRRYFKYDK